MLCHVCATIVPQLCDYCVTNVKISCHVSATK